MTAVGKGETSYYALRNAVLVCGRESITLLSAYCRADVLILGGFVEPAPTMGSRQVVKRLKWVRSKVSLWEATAEVPTDLAYKRAVLESIADKMSLCRTATSLQFRKSSGDPRKGLDEANGPDGELPDEELREKLRRVKNAAQELDGESGDID
jgi:hypothetical protein